MPTPSESAEQTPSPRTALIVRSVSIRREGDYGGYGTVKATAPFRATVEVASLHGKIELILSPDMSARIVDIVADEIVAAGRATADALTAEAFDHKALAGPEQVPA